MARAGAIRLSLVLAVLAAPALIAQGPSAPRYDILILNGHIVDGTGSPWYSGDIGIRDGRITAIGRLEGAAARDAHRRQGIDRRARIHRHARPVRADRARREPHLPSKIFQGITTEITGEGGSAAPLNDAIVQADQRLVLAPEDHRWTGRTWRGTSRAAERAASASISPPTSARPRCDGWCSATPTCSLPPAQLDHMKALVVRQAMQQGAVGRVHLAALPAGVLRHDRGADRAGAGGRAATVGSTPPTSATRATR